LAIAHWVEAVNAKFDLATAAAHLVAGGVVAAPTETFYGLLADATNPRAVDTVLSLKPRDAGKGIGLLLPNRDSWSSVVAHIPPLAARLADEFWPGPLTIVLPAAANLDSRLTLGGAIGVRWGSASLATELAAAFSRPLTATSANPPGEPPAGLASDVEAAFGPQIAQGLLRVIPGTSPGGLASTVATVSDAGVKIVRAGAVSAEALARVVGTLI
jgi:L-threonylcarbamoyladenylate synthase